MMKSNDKILKGTIVRMMDTKPYKILEDTTAHGLALMIQVKEDYSKKPKVKKGSLLLLLDEFYGLGEDRQSVLYDPFLEKEKEKEKEFLNRKLISRFELMEI